MIHPIGERRTFAALRADGIRVRRGALGATFLEESPPAGIRVAYAIPKRVGGAVVRNRVKRRLRAVVAELAADSDLVPVGALLISVGPDVDRRSPQELRNDVRSLLEALQQRRSVSSIR